MTRWRVVGQSAPKSTRADAANQDRWCVAIGPPLRVAIADGATQSFRPGPWAAVLVEAFAGGVIRPGQRTDVILERLQSVTPAWKAQTVLGPDAPWHQEARSLRGAAAAFAGIEVRWRHRRWEWSSLALGDSVVIVLHADGTISRSVPLEGSGWEPKPLMFSTRPTNNEAVRGVRLRARGHLPGSFTIVLATDAIAYWLLAKAEQHDLAVSALRQAVTSRPAFGAFVEQLRSEGVPDDDMTMVVVDRR